MHNGAAANGDTILRCEHIARSYQQGNERLPVLEDIDFSIEQGSSIAIVGASGSGKSTLLNILGGLDQPSSGKVWIRGQCLDQLDDTAMSRLRNRDLGFVYQFHHLLPEFSALENVAMPLMIAGMARAEAQAKADRLLDTVGLAERRGHRPSELSGGERQRVAIARALVNEPACVLMDEPTGNLDRQSTQVILDLVASLSSQLQTSFIVVTHDEQVASAMDRVLVLKDGVLQTGSSSPAQETNA